MNREWLSIASTKRFATGVIATLSDGETTYAQHFTGEGLQAVRAVAAFCDAHGLGVVTISTPATIFRDLQGTREPRTMRVGRVSGEEKPAVDRVDVPERSMLGKIGRRDLLIGWEAEPRHG